MGSGDAPLIELVEISRTYRESGRVVNALSGITFRVAIGQLVCITGPSGAGKSTLLHLLGGLDRPTSGVYRFGGKDVGNLDGHGAAAFRRDAVGLVFQRDCLIESATAVENVGLPAVYRGLRRRDREDRARQLLMSLGLGDRLDHFPAELSGGERQRVAIARALINGGSVILADEPTASLDSANGAQVLRHLRDLARSGRTVLVATHDANTVDSADCHVELRDGRVVRFESERPSPRETPPPQAPTQPTIEPVPASTGRRSRMDDLREGFTAMYRSVWRNSRLGTILTVASIAVAILSLVSLMNVVAGAAREGVIAVTHLGLDRIDVDPSGHAGADPVGLSITDVEAIRAQVRNLRQVTGSVGGEKLVQFGDRSVDVFVDASDENTPEELEWPLQRGVFYSPDRDSLREPVAVIGAAVGDALFPGDFDPIGEYVLIDRRPFRVVGVLARRTTGHQVLRDLFDATVYVPFDAGASALFGADDIRIVAFVEDPDAIEGSAKAIRDVLMRRHGREGFMVSTRAGAIDEWEVVRRLFEGILAALSIGMATLGGCGVLVLMLLSVRRRTREIGIRMAVGANARDITRQFVLEAAALAIVGGTVGAVAGMGVSYLLSLAHVPVEVAPWHFLAAFAGVATVAAMFGIVPARRAAKLDPVAALARD